MRKVQRRATICLLIAAVLFLGIALYAYRVVTQGEKWASFYGNTQIYTDGQINRGSIYDRYGTLLMNCTPDGVEYTDDYELRKATVHVVGDPDGNISTGAISIWQGELIGYDLVNGTFDATAEGKKIKLTIDAEANREAYEQLGYRQGTVGVYNYKTGEILCLVNTPSFDPAGDLPKDSEDSVYFNTFLQGTLTPGSTFKLVTSAAAINTIDIADFSYTCNGVSEIGSDRITCPYSHGTQDFSDALANSCNGAFGEIAREVGAEALAVYAGKVGLKDSITFDGITTAAGDFTFPEDNDVKLSWAGIGQADDQVNPCAMMVYVGAIANGGEAICPSLLKESNILNLSSGKSLGNYLDSNTANKLRSMMKNNVVETYGEYNFDGLDIYAKSGTAEVGDREDAWFVGFIDNEDAPLAFVVWVKGGGTGYSTAGPIARNVLNQIIADQQ